MGFIFNADALNIVAAVCYGLPMNEHLTVSIASRHQEALDIVSFRMVDPTGRPLPSFSAGSHIDVEIQPGLIRQYSLCNKPEQPFYEIAVLKDPASRGGSVGMHDLAEGELVSISQPRNYFPLTDSAKRSLLFAGGIGITPLLSMAQQLSVTHSNFRLFYCARTKKRMAFVDRINEAAYASQVSFHLDDEPFSQRLVPERELANVDKDTHVYICGPAGFMSWILNAARNAGWLESQLHVEYFANTAVQPSNQSQNFEVQVGLNGPVFTIEPDQSITNVLRTNGVYIPTSCEQGICGTCLTTVLDGVPDHRDQFLTEGERAANAMIMPCCSRAKSPRLILDI